MAGKFESAQVSLLYMYMFTSTDMTHSKWQ